MSIEPRPTAIATRSAGGATRLAPWVASIVRGEKSPATAAKSTISDSEMVRRRVVHSPPRGRSSKEIGSRSGASIARTRGRPRALTYGNSKKGGSFAGSSERPARDVNPARRRVCPADRVFDASPPDDSSTSARTGGRERRARPGRPPAGDRFRGQLLPCVGGGAERRPHTRGPDHGRGRRRHVPGHSRQGRDAPPGRVQPDHTRARGCTPPRRGAAEHGAGRDAAAGAQAGRGSIPGP